MPEAFNRCVSGGGRVITKTLPNGKFIHICFPKGGGPSIAGEVKTKQKQTNKKKK